MSQILDEAKRVFKVEINGLNEVSNSLNESLVEAVELLKTCRGKVIVSGVGKSGNIAQKFVSTLSSTGTPAVFLHPGDGAHGDLGVIDEKDVVIAISYSGNSDELIHLIKFLKRRAIPLIGICRSADSVLGGQSNIFLKCEVSEEACPLGLAPTSSSTATLVLCDALAMCLLKEKGFEKENFAEFHPGGSLGRKLLTTVKDVMIPAASSPLVGIGTKLPEILSMMTDRNVRGVCGVLDEKGCLVGAITDGDLRRKLKNSLNQWASFQNITAEDLMSDNPKFLDIDEMAEKALFLMEEFKIQCLFVTDLSSHDPKNPVGIIHFQDLLDHQIK